jgi:hypothetical protein
MSELSFAIFACPALSPAVALALTFFTSVFSCSCESRTCRDCTTFSYSAIKKMPRHGETLHLDFFFHCHAPAVAPTLPVIF